MAGIERSSPQKCGLGGGGQGTEVRPGKKLGVRGGCVMANTRNYNIKILRRSSNYIDIIRMEP